MSEPYAPVDAPHPGLAGVGRLRSLIGRPECPPWPADELLLLWHEASGTDLPFEEWCDPSARYLAATLRSPYGQREVDAAVVQFAQARAGADHTAEAVAEDLLALVRILTSDERSRHDPVSLVARALTAWAAEQVEAVAAGVCTDPVTGMVTGGFLRARLRELHAQCDALAIAPQVTFGSLVMQLDLLKSPAPERMGARVAVSRVLQGVFTAGETVAALGTSRFVAVMPAYALDRCENDLRAGLRALGNVGVPVRISREGFAGHAEATWRSLAGI